MQTRQRLSDAEAEKLLAEFDTLRRRHPEIGRLSFAEQTAILTEMAAKLLDPLEFTHSPRVYFNWRPD